MIFKRFSVQRKKPELCNICEKEMLKSIKCRKCLKAIRDTS